MANMDGINAIVDKLVDTLADKNVYAPSNGKSLSEEKAALAESFKGSLESQGKEFFDKDLATSTFTGVAQDGYNRLISNLAGDKIETVGSWPEFMNSDKFAEFVSEVLTADDHLEAAASVPDPVLNGSELQNKFAELIHSIRENPDLMAVVSDGKNGIDGNKLTDIAKISDVKAENGIWGNLDNDSRQELQNISRLLTGIDVQGNEKGISELFRRAAQDGLRNGDNGGGDNVLSEQETLKILENPKDTLFDPAIDSYRETIDYKSYFSTPTLEEVNGLSKDGIQESNTKILYRENGELKFEHASKLEDKQNIEIVGIQYQAKADAGNGNNMKNLKLVTINDKDGDKIIADLLKKTGK